MSKQLVEDAIFLNSPDEVNDVIHNFLESQKVKFICTTCGNVALKTVGSFKKKIVWECKTCSTKRASALGKKDLKTAQLKRKQTMIQNGHWGQKNQITKNIKM